MSLVVNILAMLGVLFWLSGGYFYLAYRYWMWSTQRNRQISDQVTETLLRLKDRETTKLIAIILEEIKKKKEVLMPDNSITNRAPITAEEQKLRTTERIADLEAQLVTAQNELRTKRLFVSGLKAGSPAKHLCNEFESLASQLATAREQLAARQEELAIAQQCVESDEKLIAELRDQLRQAQERLQAPLLHKVCMDSIHNYEKNISQLVADNAAITAKLAEVERERDHWRSVAQKMGIDFSDLCQQLALSAVREAELNGMADDIRSLGNYYHAHQRHIGMFLVCEVGICVRARRPIKRPVPAASTEQRRKALDELAQQEAAEGNYTIPDDFPTGDADDAQVGGDGEVKP